MVGFSPRQKRKILDLVLDIEYQFKCHTNNKF